MNCAVAQKEIDASEQIASALINDVPARCIYFATVHIVLGKRYKIDPKSAFPLTAILGLHAGAALISASIRILSWQCYGL